MTELKNASTSFIILLAEKHSIVIKQLRSGLRYEEEIEEVEPLLFFTLSQDIGKVIVRRETLGEKIVDFFNREDIDFGDYPAFSRKYFVIGEKPDLVREYFPKGLIQSLEKIDDIVVEVNGKIGLVRTEKNLTESLMYQLIDIGSEIS